jgi:hypothetical protein
VDEVLGVRLVAREGARVPSEWAKLPDDVVSLIVVAHDPYTERTQ